MDVTRLLTCTTYLFLSPSLLLPLPPPLTFSLTYMIYVPHFPLLSLTLPPPPFPSSPSPSSQNTHTHTHTHTQSETSDLDEEEALADLEVRGGAGDSEGEHADYCHTCKDGGELLCCDFCPLAYHLGCLAPPIERIPDGDWKCPRCEAKKLLGKAEKLLTWRWKEVSAAQNKKADDGNISELEDDVSLPSTFPTTNHKLKLCTISKHCTCVVYVHVHVHVWIGVAYMYMSMIVSECICIR